MDPGNGRKLYFSLIGPHLIAGCEVMMDPTLLELEVLEDVQETYLRRILMISKTAKTDFLFTETGIWPLAYRRLTLALRYLSYLADLQKWPL